MTVPAELKLNHELPRLPVWGTHRRKITAADTVLPLEATAGVNAKGWESIWLDIHFKAAGTKTATIRPVFWNPAAVPDGDDYSGAFFEQDVIADILVEAGDAGHKAIKVQLDERIAFFKVHALGAGAEVHLMVAGAVQTRVQ